MINTILIGSGLIHPGPWARWRLQRVLETVDGLRITHRPDLESVTPVDYAQAQLVVTYFQEQQLPDTAWRRIKAFVEDGGALLVVHAGTASFKTFEPWFDFIGGRFIRHDRIRRITVQPDAQSTLLADSAPFEVVEELYQHEMRGQVTIHASASDAAGAHPVVWTKHHGQGRIAYMVFGHRASAFRNPGVKRITLALVGWLTEGADG